MPKEQSRTSETEVLIVAFKVYYGRDEKASNQKEKIWCCKYTFQQVIAASQAPLLPKARELPSPYLKCYQKNH